MASLTVVGYDAGNPPSVFGERRNARMRVDDVARKCVVFIGIVNDRGTFVPLGTGFLLRVRLAGRVFDHIVTCEHVIDLIGGDAVSIRINLKAGGSGIFQTKKMDWFRHPDKENFYDVAVLPTSISQGIFDVTHASDRDFATKQVIKDKEIAPGEPTFLVGLFTSHSGEDRNEPIVRVGNIAAIFDDPIWTSKGYARGYLVEARSIGGLSGSPVYVQMAPWRVIGGKIVQAEGLTHYLLGMMRGRHNVQGAEDVVAGDNPADTVNAGIGLVIPIEIIMEVADQEALSAKRRDIIESLKKESLFRETSAPISVESEPPTKADNPSHREDFQSMLRAAAKKKPPTD